VEGCAIEAWTLSSGLVEAPRASHLMALSMLLAVVLAVLLALSLFPSSSIPWSDGVPVPIAFEFFE
jgi:hypothetical protein